MKIYEFGMGPQAKSEGYKLVDLIRSTRADLEKNFDGDDVIFVSGPAINGSTDVFEFAVFEPENSNAGSGFSDPKFLNALSGGSQGETREETLAREQAIFEKIPKLDDPLRIKISNAMLDELDDETPKPPLPKNQMTLGELVMWENRHPELQTIRFTKNAVHNHLYNAAKQGHISSDELDKILLNCRTHKGRMWVMSVIAEDIQNQQLQSRKRF